MKNKKLKYSILIFVLSWLFLFIFRLLASNHDYEKIKKGNDPTFCFFTYQYKDGGTLVHQGIGYKLFVFNKMIFQEKNEKGQVPIKYKIGPAIKYELNWFLVKFKDNDETSLSNENAARDASHP